MAEGDAVIGPHRRAGVVDQLHQGPVVGVAVVALVVVVDHGLPVGRDVALEAVDANQLVEPRTGLVHVAEQGTGLVGERPRGGVHADEEQAAVHLEPDRLEIGVVGNPVLQGLAPTRLAEAAVVAVAPLVIGAGDELAVARALQQRVGAVAAHIVEGAQFTVLAADHEDPLVGDLGRQVVALLREVAQVTNVPPGPMEDRPLLGTVDRRVPVPLGRQGEGALGDGIKASGIERRRRRERDVLVHGRSIRDRSSARRRHHHRCAGRQRDSTGFAGRAGRLRTGIDVRSACARRRGRRAAW